MPKPAIKKGSDHFFNVLYEGNGGGQKVGKFVPFTDNGTIDKSCIFDSASNVSLTRTPSSAGNRKTFTVSFWVKRGRLGDAAGNNTYGQRIFNAGTSSNWFDIKFSGSGDTEGADRLHLREYASSAEQLEYWTNRTFEDTTKWYNIVVQVNTTESTSTNRIKVYVDGDQVTSWYRSNAPSQDYDTQVNATVLHNIGRYTGATSNNLDAYLAEFNFVDGSIVAPSTFGVTDTSTGRWVPKSLTGITYGTNGFRMEYANSAGQTIGDDTSGNTNDYAVSNIAVTDLTTDSPTQNFATGFHNQSDNGTITRAEGNLYSVQGNNTSKMGTMRSTLTLDPNDPNLYYCEYHVGQEHGGNGTIVGISDVRADGVRMNSSTLRFEVGTNYMFACDTYVVIEQNGADAGTGNDSTRNPEYTTNDYIGVAFQAGKVWIAKNNTWSNSGNPANGTGFLVDLPKDTLYRFVAGQYGSSSGNYGTFNFGQKSFNYTPPTGAKNLQQDNLPAAGKDFADLVWIKNRDATDDHQLYDSTRGAQKMIESNTNAVEETDDDGLQKFLNGGCAIEDDVRINTVGESYVSWNWHANGGTTAANTDGSGASIASTTQANQTAGFSIVTWTGTGSNGTVAHGLSSAPEWMLIKNLTASGQSWHVYHVTNGNGKAMFLDTNANVSTSSQFFNDTTPTNKVFTVGTSGGVNQSTKSMLAYCWHSVKGYSKFGTYTGGGGTDGTFTHLGFKPAWLLVKRYGSTGNWYQFDNARGPVNTSDGAGKTLMPNHTNAEAVQTRVDFLSNGFKQRISNDGSNLNSATYIYMAFAEHPVLGNGTNPVTAR